MPPKKAKTVPKRPTYDPQKLYTYDNSIALEQPLESRMKGGPFEIGEWSLLFTPLPEDDDDIDGGTGWLRLRWKDSEPAPVLKLEFIVETDLGVQTCDLIGGPCRWPSTRSGELSILLRGCGAYYVNEHHPRLEMHAPWRKRGTELIAWPYQTSIHYLDPPAEGDVRLIFPSLGAELLSTSSLLKQHSSFLAARLSAEDGEKVNKSSWKKRARQTAPKEFYLRDSDEEDDLQLVTKPRLRKQSYDVPTHEIIVTETASTTYSALLFSLQYDRPIEWKPLIPLQQGRGEHHVVGGLSQEADEISLGPPFPRASPRSMYRLAAHLKIASVADLALKEYGNQLSRHLDRVVDEVFSETSALHGELRNTAVAVALLAAAEVRQTSSYQKLASKPTVTMSDEEKWFLAKMKAMR